MTRCSSMSIIFSIVVGMFGGGIAIGTEVFLFRHPTTTTTTT